MNQCNNIIKNLSKDKWHLQTFKRRVLETKWYLKSRRWFTGESVAEQNELHKWQWENCPMRQKWYWKLKLESIPEVDDEEEPEEDEEEFEYSEEFPDTKDQSSTNRPVSHGPNTPGCLLFKHPQLSNTGRVHLTTQSLDGKVDNDDGHQDSRPPRTSQSPSTTRIAAKSGRMSTAMTSKNQVTVKTKTRANSTSYHNNQQTSCGSPQ